MPKKSTEKVLLLIQSMQIRAIFLNFLLYLIYFSTSFLKPFQVQTPVIHKQIANLSFLFCTGKYTLM